MDGTETGWGRPAEPAPRWRALLDRAQSSNPLLEPGAKCHSVFKVYVRSAKHLEMVRDVLRAPFLLSGDLLFLQGELCRRELLVEVEGLVTAD